MPGYFVRVLFAPRYVVDGPAELKLPKGALSYGGAMRLKESPVLFDEVGVDDGEAIRSGGGYEAAAAEGVAIN